MTSLNKNETPVTANHIGNYALPEFHPETGLECCGPVEWPASRSFTNIEKAIVIKAVLVSGPTTTDAGDVRKSLGFRLMSVGFVFLRWYAQGMGSPARNRKHLPTQRLRSEARMTLGETAPVNAFKEDYRLPIFSGSGSPFLNAVWSIQS
jgi:hypothetical protein